MTKSREHMELEQAVKEFLDSLDAGPFSFSTGVCCCGDEMASHSGWEGHPATDEGLYWYDQSTSRLRSML